MLNLQNRTAEYMMTSQTTRHFIGYHQTQMMGKPNVVITDRDLYDQFLPAYKAFQTEGQANGIMCGYAAFDGTYGAHFVPCMCETFTFQRRWIIAEYGCSN